MYTIHVTPPPTKAFIQAIDLHTVSNGCNSLNTVLWSKRDRIITRHCGISDILALDIHVHGYFYTREPPRPYGVQVHDRTN